MKTFNDVDVVPVSDISGTDLMSTKEDLNTDLNGSDSQYSTQENSLDDESIVPSSPSTVAEENNSCEQEDDSDYFAQFSCPEDSDDESAYFYDKDNVDLFLNSKLHRKQMDLAENLEDQPYQRSKRSNKKINARCQIKTKQAKSIRTNSHNKQLYMHHRLFKKVNLDPPSCHYLPSNSTIANYSLESFRSRIDEQRQRKVSPPVQNKIRSQPPPTNQFREYTFSEQNVPRGENLDDAMIAFLIDMQNRDLSPEDYEMLLRLDERVQRKTVDTNVLNRLQTINANETHANDHCSICIEPYVLGQQLKLLPCSHMFHLNCIETYLKEFSTQCPLDNLPLI